jgi:hypothetical protein
MNFSKNTIEGQKNLETFRALKKHSFLYGFFYFFIFVCSVITSGYASWTAGSMLGMILICIIEIIRWISLQPANFNLIHFRIGAIVATAFSIITASMSIWLYNTSHNSSIEANSEIVESLKQEKQLLETKLNLVMVNQVKAKNPQQQINQILNSNYKVKRWSTTQNLTGRQIVTVKNCGKSDTCRRIQNSVTDLKTKILAYDQRAADLNKTQQRYQQVQQQLTSHLKISGGDVAIPIFITVSIMIMLIFVIDYGLWLCGLQIRITKPNLLEYRRAFRVWKIMAKNKTDKKDLFEKAIVPESVKAKPAKQKLDSSEKIQQVINAVNNDNGVFTIANVQKHLQALNFGKTVANAKMVVAAKEQQDDR